MSAKSAGKKTDTLLLDYSAPIAAFRPFQSREYQDTLDAPPPSTILGMLLSLCGMELERREEFAGVELAQALREPLPQRSAVLRRMRRGGVGGPVRNPEFQELLTGLSGRIALRPGVDGAGQGLIDAVAAALLRPEEVSRYGGLALGESAFLVDELSLVGSKDGKPPKRDAARETEGGRLCWLLCDAKGELELTTWIVYERPGATRKARFRLEPEASENASGVDSGSVPADAWIALAPGGA